MPRLIQSVIRQQGRTHKLLNVPIVVLTDDLIIQDHKSVLDQLGENVSPESCANDNEKFAFTKLVSKMAFFSHDSGRRALSINIWYAGVWGWNTRVTDKNHSKCAHFWPIFRASPRGNQHWHWLLRHEESNDAISHMGKWGRAPPTHDSTWLSCPDKTDNHFAKNLKKHQFWPWSQTFANEQMTV